MSDEQLLGRPVGWWLKEADARLNAAFDRALEGSEVDRRGWQALSSLSKRPASRAELFASLKSFDSPEVVAGVVAELQRHGWVDEEDGLLRLTSSGAQKQTDLAPLAERVRQQVQSARPEMTTSVSSDFSLDSPKRCDRQRPSDRPAGIPQRIRSSR